MKIVVEPCHIGNQIFRYMFAEHVRGHRPDSTITGYRMPEFGMVSQAGAMDALLRTGVKHKQDVPALLRQVDDGGYDGLLIDSCAQRLEYFETQREAMAAVLNSSVAGHPTTDDELVIGIRGGDILRGVHPDYMPLPFSFYRQLIADSGLKPAFVGQIGDDEYSHRLRAAFPSARFLASAAWIEDFQTVRNARHIVVAVSSFSWSAAWLSKTAETIHLPVAGFINPLQRPDLDLLPRHDPRYVFHEFPVQKFTASAKQMAAIVS
jgi:hypothetical protein